MLARSPVVVVPAGRAGDGAAAHEDHLVGELDGRRHPVERLRALLHADLKSVFLVTANYWVATCNWTGTSWAKIFPIRSHLRFLGLGLVGRTASA